MTTASTAPTTRNGVYVDRLVATIGAIKGQPELADSRFRARTTWVPGGHARTTIQDFFGAGGEHTSRTLRPRSSKRLRSTCSGHRRCWTPSATR
jgi:hypothetical protein